MKKLVSAGIKLKKDVWPTSKPDVRVQRGTKYALVGCVMALNREPRLNVVLKLAQWYHRFLGIMHS